MPWGLKRFHKSHQLHFLTFSCYHRRPNFGSVASRTVFESALERIRQKFGLCVYGYVVMPEHVHLLVNEPERGILAQAMQSLKLRRSPQNGSKGNRSFLAGSLLRFQPLE
jgi:putative transposase